ncbi:hypothetical protein CEXT_352881 [Caerostris extrusa]|uniref:Uncharacterized protein n=1 Tax=Caerostris extrusa TaxID=172846 RepID=A0AAV4MFV6_CAEEX|nr:hypothetical protein CEXT_352881 [Caerostris extrusa]
MSSVQDVSFHIIGNDLQRDKAVKHQRWKWNLCRNRFILTELHRLSLGQPGAPKSEEGRFRSLTRRRTRLQR